MKRVLLLLVMCLLICNLIHGQAQSKPVTTPQTGSGSAQSRVDTEAESAATGKLPVRRVVLYKNGVGYFEHLGRVRGSQDVHIDFTSAQLNDVLKSLTVLDLSGGRISGVDYNSEFPPSGRQQETQLDSLRKEHSIHG